jgi:hypothetical protein
MDKQELKEIETKIRKILMKEWDPIGVDDIPEAQDEYDRYIPQVISLLLRGATPEEIAEYLSTVEAREMGLGLHTKNDLLPLAVLLLKIVE